MPKKKESIYLETSVISAYFDFKNQDPERKRITRKFWKDILPKFNALISDTVILELGKREEYVKKFLEFIKDIPRLKEDKESAKLADAYIGASIIQKSKPLDASHLAIATNNKIDYLVSWNQQDIVNPEQRRKVSQFNRSLNLLTPTIATPDEFLNLR